MNEPLLHSEDVDANQQMHKHSTPSFQPNFLAQQPESDADFVQNHDNIDPNPQKNVDIPKSHEFNEFDDNNQNYHINPSREDINLVSNNDIDKIQKENEFNGADPFENRKDQKGEKSQKNDKAKKPNQRKKNKNDSDSARCCCEFCQMCLCLATCILTFQR